MKSFYKILLFSAVITAITFPSSPLFAAGSASLGDTASRPESALQIQQASDSADQITFKREGTPVFASNAPETLFEGNRSDGSKVVQVNNTLYRDRMKGSFRFWSVHTNATKKRVSFYMHVKNPAANPVKLYIKRKGYSSGSSADPVTSLKAATTQFLNQSAGTGGTYLATIAPGKSYVLPYSTSIAPYQVMNYIADFRAVNVKTGQSETVIVSDIVTNNGIAKLEDYASSARIAQTNFDFKTGDDYRGLLKYSARKVELKVQLTEGTPAKYIKMSDSEPLAYSGEQERLASSWNVQGEPLKSSIEVVGKNNKQRGSYWFTDLVYNIQIQTPSDQANIHTLYGAAPRSESTGYVHYRIDNGPVESYSYGNRQTRIISNTSSFTLTTMIQPFLSVPLGLYFVSE
ncbi:hypothetical protein [Paenibacillus sp. YPG26]|uniref:hypothetical protein n=1 Tax=Paenibacillus sp. YPG26 TaxID=2878915 RepID=UPI00203CD38A|nr:hypothetical protein [Paenibacillus sp. YPG26]USB33848.1 hypothetical protein LDO05_03220 [Paenibacillus sp. YPG26]